jgi:hypothetical protein
MDEAGLPGPRGGPKRVADDLEMRGLHMDPLALGIEPQRDASGVRVLEPAAPVPDHLADIELIVDDAGTQGPVAPDRGVAPPPAPWGNNTLFIQLDGDAARALAGGIVAEDAPDDLGLLGDDLALAGRDAARRVDGPHNPIAIGVAASDLARLHPPPDAAMGLGREVLQEQRVHRSFEPDMKLGDLALG